jgi:hypothetical protein
MDDIHDITKDELRERTMEKVFIQCMTVAFNSPYQLVSFPSTSFVQ